MLSVVGSTPGLPIYVSLQCLMVMCRVFRIQSLYRFIYGTYVHCTVYKVPAHPKENYLLVRGRPYAGSLLQAVDPTFEEFLRRNDFRMPSMHFLLQCSFPCHSGLNRCELNSKSLPGRSSILLTSLFSSSHHRGNKIEFCASSFLIHKNINALHVCMCTKKEYNM
jgi:hypothetical protein